MRLRWTAAVGLALGALGLTIGLAAAEKPAATPDSSGWISLLDGKDLNAWRAPGSEKWKNVGGVLTWRKDCGNIWSRKKFGDFVLDLEFRIAKGTNSGIFLRCGDLANWMETCIEIQILDSYRKKNPGRQDCGAIFDILAPRVNAMKPAGQWNHITITFRGNRLQATLNDQEILDADLDLWTEAGKNPDGTSNKFHTAYKDMPKAGHIGLQDHGSPVWFRHIKIKPLQGEKEKS